MVNEGVAPAVVKLVAPSLGDLGDHLIIHRYAACTHCFWRTAWSVLVANRLPAPLIRLLVFMAPGGIRALCVCLCKVEPNHVSGRRLGELQDFVQVRKGPLHAQCRTETQHKSKIRGCSSRCLYFRSSHISEFRVYSWCLVKCQSNDKLNTTVTCQHGRACRSGRP